MFSGQKAIYFGISLKEKSAAYDMYENFLITIPVATRLSGHFAIEPFRDRVSTVQRRLPHRWPSPEIPRPWGHRLIRQSVNPLAACSLPLPPLAKRENRVPYQGSIQEGYAIGIKPD